MVIEGNAESLLESFYRGWLRPGDCAVDVGAHTGRHTIPLAETVAPEGSVFSFEPLPFAAGTLSTRLNNAGLVSVVRLERAAVAEVQGNATFVVALDRPEESGLRERAFYNGETRTQRISVHVTTLDLSIPKDARVRFLKIDVEGGEWGVLRGAESLIHRCQPAIGFEFSARAAAAFGTTPNDLFDWLAQRGYVIFDLRGHRHSRDSFADRCGTAMIWDYLAVLDGTHAIEAKKLLEQAYRTSIVAAKDERSDADYVAQCYRELLGREPDEGGLVYYVGLLETHGWTRDEIAAMLRNSDEYRLRR